MRLFIGIYPNKETLDYVRDVQRALDKEKRNLRLVDLQQVHLTLKFIGGHVSDLTKNQMVEKLLSVQGQYAKPTIELTHLQVGFPRQHDPRVLFANVRVDKSLAMLQDQITSIIRKVDAEDYIRWKPSGEKDFHISIARLKPARTRSSGKDLIEAVKNLTIPLPAPYQPTEFVVMQSVIRADSAPVYKPLVKIRL
jgi:2'-5' RNA ligase